jgi:hypothetical protein
MKIRIILDEKKENGDEGAFVVSRIRTARRG